VKLHKDNNGSTIVMGLLFVVLIAVISSTGWYVYSSRKHASDILNQVSKTQVSAIGIDQSTDWKSIKSINGLISMKIPDGWKIINDTATDGLYALEPSDIIYQAGNPAIISNNVVPGTDAPLRFQIFTADRDYQGWTSIKAKKTAFGMIDNATVIRYSDKAGPQKGAALGPTEGEIDYEYLIDKAGKFYHAAYRVLPGEKDNFIVVEEALRSLKVQ